MTGNGFRGLGVHTTRSSRKRHTYGKHVFQKITVPTATDLSSASGMIEMRVLCVYYPRRAVVNGVRYTKREFGSRSASQRVFVRGSFRMSSFEEQTVAWLQIQFQGFITTPGSGPFPP